MSSIQVTLTRRGAAAVLAGCLLVVGGWSAGSFGSGLASPTAASARTARAVAATTSLVSSSGKGQVIGFYPTGPI